MLQRVLPYLVAGLGTWVALQSISFDGAKALALIVLAFLLWAFSLAEAVIGIIAEWRAGMSEMADAFYALSGLPANIRNAMAGFQKFPAETKVVVSQLAGARVSLMGAPLPPNKLATIQQTIEAGRKFTIRNYVPLYLSDQEYRTFHAWAVERGYLAEVRPDFPQRGYYWTKKGESFWAAVKMSQHSPTAIPDLTSPTVR